MAVNTNQVNVLSYASTNVGTSNYVTLIASTSISISKLEILDTSTKIIKLAIGDSGNEIDICTCPVSGTIILPMYIPAGSRISAKAVDANATTGYNVLSLLS